MSHAHDQTLLARLGFQDPDRKTPDHDLACRYLSQRDQLRKIVALYLPFSERWGAYGNHPTRDIAFDMCAAGSALLECPLTKGEGRYKTHIGFVDLVAKFDVLSSVHKERSAISIAIEVKIAPIDVSTILRQLNLYKQYTTTDPKWLLVTAFEIDIEEIKTLGNVRHVYLNPDYKSFASQPKAKSQVI